MSDIFLSFSIYWSLLVKIHLWLSFWLCVCVVHVFVSACLFRWSDAGDLVRLYTIVHPDSPAQLMNLPHENPLDVVKVRAKQRPFLAQAVLWFMSGRVASVNQNIFFTLFFVWQSCRIEFIVEVSFFSDVWLWYFVIIDNLPLFRKCRWVNALWPMLAQNILTDKNWLKTLCSLLVILQIFGCGTCMVLKLIQRSCRIPPTSRLFACMEFCMLFWSVCAYIYKWGYLGLYLLCHRGIFVMFLWLLRCF